MIFSSVPSNALLSELSLMLPSAIRWYGDFDASLPNPDFELTRKGLDVSGNTKGVPAEHDMTLSPCICLASAHWTLLTE
jgi:hypothetical protein